MFMWVTCVWLGSFLTAVRKDLPAKSALGFLLPEHPGESFIAKVLNEISLMRKDRKGVRLHEKDPAAQASRPFSCQVSLAQSAQ